MHLQEVEREYYSDNMDKMVDVLGKTVETMENIIDPGTGISRLAYALRGEYVSDRRESVKRAVKTMVERFVMPVQFRYSRPVYIDQPSTPREIILDKLFEIVKISADAATWTAPILTYMVTREPGTALGVKLLSNIIAPHVIDVIGTRLNQFLTLK